MRFAFLPGLAGAAVLALVAAIVVGLYLLRPPPQRMVLASTLLWERVLQRTRGASQRWRWWLSLLLSTLIALAVAAAWLRPERDAANGAANRPVVLVIDNSPTMGALRADGRTRLAHAVDAARRELAPSAGRFMVLDTMRMLGPAGFTDAARAAARLDELKPASGVTPRFPELAALPPAIETPDVVFVTDGVAPIAVPADVRTVPVFEPAANTGITAFDVRSLPADPTQIEAFVEVGNAATVAMKVTVRVSGAGHDPVARAITVPARGFASVTLPVSGFSGGALRAGLDAPDDALAADDEAFAFLPFNRTLSVALVTTGNAPLERALRLDPRVRLTVLAPSQFARRAGFDAYVLDRFAPPNAPAAPVLAIAPPKVSWLPAPGAVRTGIAATSWKSADPVFENVSLADVQIERAQPFVAPSGVDVLARADDGAVLAVAGAASPRKVALAFAIQASSFASQASFPVFVSNALAWLTSEETPVAKSVGPVNLPMARASVRGLEAGPMDTRFVPGATLFTASAPDFFTAESQGRRVRVLVNVLDPAVTDINASRLAAQAPATVADDASDGPSGVDAWQVLLAIAGALMLLEWLTYHRRVTV